MVVDNENLKVNAAQSWDEVVPKVFKQMQLEAAHNRRLREATKDTDFTTKGIYRYVSLHLTYMCIHVPTDVYEYMYMHCIGFFCFLPTGSVLLALTLLPYVLPDVRTTPCSENIIYFTKVCMYHVFLFLH